MGVKSVGLVKYAIQYGQICVGDVGLLQAREGVELGRTIDQQGRPIACG